MAEKLLYTARADVFGGRNGSGATDDGALEIDLRRPAEMGGEGGGTNPEQLFAIGYGACFLGALGTAARRARLEDAVADARLHSEVTLSSNDARGFQIGVSLAVTLPSVSDIAVARELVETAHQVCPYSNATRGNIAFTLSVNGETVESPAAPVAEPS